MTQSLLIVWLLYGKSGFEMTWEMPLTYFMKITENSECRFQNMDKNVYFQTCPPLCLFVEPALMLWPVLIPQ